jgi:hypothetical protein
MKLTGIRHYNIDASRPSAFILRNGLLQARNSNRQISLLSEEFAVLKTKLCRATNFVLLDGRIFTQLISKRVPLMPKIK